MNDHPPRNPYDSEKHCQMYSEIVMHWSVCCCTTNDKKKDDEQYCLFSRSGHMDHHRCDPRRMLAYSICLSFLRQLHPNMARLTQKPRCPPMQRAVRLEQL
jgi:hypothetical protein